MRYEGIVLALSVLFSCGPVTIEEQACTEAGQALTYENFGRSFMDTHCQTCHGGLGSSRKGAPLSYDFGTVELVQAYKDRIFIRAASANTTMPPGPDDPDESSRAQLAEWLACGAP